MRIILFDTQEQLDDTFQAKKVGAQGRRDEIIRLLTSGEHVTAVVGGLPVGGFHYEPSGGGLTLRIVSYARLLSSLPADIVYNPNSLAPAIAGRLGINAPGNDPAGILQHIQKQHQDVYYYLHELTRFFDAWKKFTTDPDVSLGNPSAHANAMAYRAALDQAYDHLLRCIQGHAA